MRRHWILAMIFVMISLCLGTVAFAEKENSEDEPTGERLIVIYESDKLENSVIKKFAKNAAESEGSIDKKTPLERISGDMIQSQEVVFDKKGIRTEQITLDESVDADEYIENLKKQDGVELVEKDYELEYLDDVSDPYYENQWYLAQYQIKKLWDRVGLRGEDVVVAVIDSGIDEYHEDLVGRIANGGYNFGDRNDSLTDYAGHGTAVSGVISATVDNGKGIAGIAGDLPIKILPLKVEDIWGRMYVSYAIAAIDYAIEKDVDIINISSGVSQYSYAYHRAIQRANDAGIMVFASAGNFRQKGNPLFYPAAYEESISVGSVSEQQSVSYFSESNEFVDFVGPGEEILTTKPYDSYESTSGTSFSSPFVAGAAAILKSLNPDLSSFEIRELLAETAIDLGANGKDDDYGYGLVQPLKAVEQLIQNLEGAELPDEKWQIWDSKTTSDINKVWQVKFNQVLEMSSLNDTTILVRDALNRKFDVKFALSEDEKTLKITPVKSYESGENYTLYISTKVKSKDGKFLKEPIKMTFNVD